MASNFSDDARRADILRRAHEGLEEDLDDMRSELMDILPDYEQRLRQNSDALPTWLEITPAQVRALFHLRPVAIETHADPDTPPAASAEHGILGPRTVALAAGRIETFIDEGFVDADFDDDTRTQRLVELYTETTFYLNALIREARRVSEDARATLDAWLDAVLFDLESQRKSDVEALEELVGNGDIGRGGSARQEIADLWEDQRRRAAYLQASWQPLTALVHEGLTTTESGLRELADLLMRARAGLVGANAAIEPQLAPFEWPAAPHRAQPAQPKGPAEVDDAGPTLDLSRPSEYGRGADVDALLEDTLIPGLAADDVDEFAVEPAHDDFNTLPPGGFVPGIIPLDEPTSDPVTAPFESVSVSNYSEPADESATDDAAAPRTSTQRMYTRQETPSAGHVAAPEPAPRQTDPSPAFTDEMPSLAAKPTAPVTTPIATGLLSDEATYTQCFRIRPGFERAGLLEVIAILLPPAAVLATMAVMSVLHLAGAGANPFEQWSWAFSAVSASLAWLLLLPALRRWRTKWLGTKLVIMRHADVREEASLRFDKQALSLNDDTWRWDRLTVAELRRWDSPLDEVCGWTLSLAAPQAPPLRLASPESNRKKWQNSPYQLVEIPYDAWQVSPFDFDTIARRAL